ncbi:MAG: histidine phosphatase family protein [Gemmatimonadota bacterium]
MAETPLLYLVRHAQTDANVERRYAGWSDDSLNETGRGQARALGDRLASHGIRHVYSSPVRRAVETAELLADAWEAEVRTVHDLHEIEIGPWRGFTEAEVEKGWPGDYRRWREEPAAFRLEGRESLAGLAERAVQALDQIGHAQLAADEAPAVIVSHLALIRVLWLTARNAPLAEYHRVAAPHCEVFALRWLGRGRLAPEASPPN